MSILMLKILDVRIGAVDGEGKLIGLKDLGSVTR
jgi:hypothetical protein